MEVVEGKVKFAEEVDIDTDVELLHLFPSEVAHTVVGYLRTAERSAPSCATAGTGLPRKAVQIVTCDLVVVEEV